MTQDHRDALGRRVREVWVAWAQRQPDPKPSWLVPYDDLDEADKEADRCIGSALWGDGFAQGMDALPAKFEAGHQYTVVFTNPSGEKHTTTATTKVVSGPPMPGQDGDGMVLDNGLVLSFDGALPVEMAAGLGLHGVVVLASEGDVSRQSDMRGQSTLSSSGIGPEVDG